MEAYNSRDNMCKFHDFVLGHGHGKMAKIRETPKIKNFLLSINSKWPPRSKSCYNLGSAANVRSLYALFGGYSHNSEVFE